MPEFGDAENVVFSLCSVRHLLRATHAPAQLMRTGFILRAGDLRGADPCVVQCVAPWCSTEAIAPGALGTRPGRERTGRQACLRASPMPGEMRAIKARHHSALPPPGRRPEVPAVTAPAPVTPQPSPGPAAAAPPPGRRPEALAVTAPASGTPQPSPGRAATPPSAKRPK